MPVHRVQVIKQESAALGGNAADEVDYPAPIKPQEDAPEVRRLYLQHDAVRDESVFVDRNAAGELALVDQVHANGALLQHLLGSSRRNGYLEVTRSNGQVTDVIVYTNSGKTQKVHEVNITRSSGLVSQIVEKLYDASGALPTGSTFTSTITRSSGRVASITVVQS